MSLAVYLTELLKTNDCVIIPDLGGFIANYLPATSNDQGDQFYPPTKELIFNSKLKKNDGLLVNYISEREGIGYLEARKVVSEFVSESISRLENGEKVELDQIGSLCYDSNEHLLFSAGTREFLRTDTFGLNSFQFPRVTSKYAQPSNPVFSGINPEYRSPGRPVVKYALVAVPLLAALYFLPKFLLTESPFKQQTANTASLTIKDTPVSVKPGEVNPALNTASEPVRDATAVEKEAEGKSLGNETTGAVNTAPDTVAPKFTSSVAIGSVNGIQTTGRFHIVGGCFKIRENAEKLAEKLALQGYHPEVSNLGKEFFRVSVETFQERKEAEKILAKLQEAEPENGYWLMVDRN